MKFCIQSEKKTLTQFILPETKVTFKKVTFKKKTVLNPERKPYATLIEFTLSCYDW